MIHQLNPFQEYLMVASNSKLFKGVLQRNTMLVKKGLMLFVFAIFLISFVNAGSEVDIDLVAKDKVINLTQTCTGCSFVNLTSVSYPNRTLAYIGERVMTANGNTYYFEWNDTDALGVYEWCYHGDVDGINDVPACLKFKVTPNGEESSTGTSIMHLGFISMLIGLFVLTLWFSSKLPKESFYAEDNELIGVNKLKFLRPVLYMAAWMVLIAIVFTGANIALAYLTTQLLGDILFKTFYIMMAMTLPIVVIWFIYIFYSIFQQKKMENLIHRGFEWDR